MKKVMTAVFCFAFPAFAASPQTQPGSKLVTLYDDEADALYDALGKAGLHERSAGRNSVSLGAFSIFCDGATGSDDSQVTCKLTTRDGILTATPSASATLFQIFRVNGGQVEGDAHVVRSAGAYEVSCKRNLAVDNLTVCSFYPGKKS